MIDVVSVNTMRISDSIKCNEVSSLFLMYQAALKIYQSYKWHGNTLIVCGSGNNGGDGYCLATLLKADGYNVNIIKTSDKLSNDSKYYHDICLKNNIDIRRYEDNTTFLGYDVIVDAIFGTGFNGDVSGIYFDIINKINNSKAFIISIDINSGLNGDTGLASIAVKSDITMSIGTFKTGHFLNMAKDYIKDKINLDIDIPIIDEKYYLLEKYDLVNIFKDRPNFSNKGDYGYVALIGGSIEYSGAIRLAYMANAAIYSGCGVSMCVIPNNIANIVANNILEATIYPLDEKDGNIVFNKDKLDYLIKRCEVISFGMGIKVSDEAAKILKYLILNYDKKLVIDADGLNILSKMKDILIESKAKIVLTPHTKEFSRLIERDIDIINQNSIEYAMEFAKGYNITLLLKGPSTIITDGEDLIIVDKGCSGMATAGSGDVLSGIITGILGYNDNILLAASASAYVNGLAGEMAEKENSSITMTSKDTVLNIKNAINEIIKHNKEVV